MKLVGEFEDLLVGLYIVYTDMLIFIFRYTLNLATNAWKSDDG